MAITFTRLLTISRRLLFTTCITHPLPPLLVQAFQFERCTFTDSAVLENPIKSPLGIFATYGDWGLTKKAKRFPGMDYEHWGVYIHEAGGERAGKEKIIDCCIKTLAQVVGSEEEAKKKIYNVVCDPKFRLVFGCQLDWKTAYKLEYLPQVDQVSVGFYHNRETKDYGGELLVNGKNVQRSPK